MLVTISGDANSSVKGIPWKGSAWGSWGQIASTAANRAYLSGYASPSGAAVVWTEPSASGYQIVGTPFTMR